MRFKIRIELMDISDPVIWREMYVPVKVTFHDLHKMIQCAMGWRNAHLYLFSESPKSKYFQVDSPYTEEGAISATTASASNIMLKYLNQFNRPGRPVDKMYYLYDLGDSWQHSIEVLDIDDAESNVPAIIAGDGACPPEDCMGLPGYEDLKKCIKTGKPSKLFGENRLPWLKATGYAGFDPGVFEEDKARMRLKNWYELK